MLIIMWRDTSPIFERALFCILFCIIFVNGVSGVIADEVKSVSVMEGDSVTLHTDVTELQRDDHILWMFGPQEKRIAEIHTQNINMFNSKEIFGDRLKLDSQTGSLSITHMRISDSGLYKLQIRSDRGNSDKRFSVMVYAPLPVPVISRDSSQCSSSSERSSVCVLLCSVLNVSHVSLSWYKGSSLLSSISVSDLNIRLSLPLEVNYEDTNTYTCVLNNTITNNTQQLHNNEVCQCSDYFSKAIYAAIISFVLIILAAGFYLLYRKRKKASKKGFKTCDHAVVQREEVQYAETVVYRQNKQKKDNGTDETIYSTVI